jgi:hypothetical protein
LHSCPPYFSVRTEFNPFTWVRLICSSAKDRPIAPRRAKVIHAQQPQAVALLEATGNPNVKALADAEQYTLALTQLEDLTGFRKRLQAIITPYSIESHQK